MKDRILSPFKEARIYILASTLFLSFNMLDLKQASPLNVNSRYLG